MTAGNRLFSMVSISAISGSGFAMHETRKMHRLVIKMLEFLMGRFFWIKQVINFLPLN
jgi:hypothetical protein